MVTPDVDELARRQLRDAGSTVVDVDLISPNWSITASWWTSVFTKLAIFSIGRYDPRVAKVAFIDLDAFLVSDTADSIFDACGVNELCAVRDAANLCQNPQTKDQWVCASNSPGSNAMMNAGVMVAKPNEALLAGLKLELSSVVKPYATLPEQEFLSAHYLKGNAVRTEHERNFAFISPEFGQCWASGPQLERAKIVHNCGPFKYGHHPLCAWDEAAGPECQQRLLAWSEGPERAAEKTRQRVLSLYQELLLTANPCAINGRDKSTCDAADAISTGQRCGWCEQVGCVPEGTCLPNETPAKRAQAERWRVYLKEREWLAEQAQHARRRADVAGGPPLPPGSLASAPPGALAPPGGLAPPMIGSFPPTPPTFLWPVGYGAPPIALSFSPPPPSPSPRAAPMSPPPAAPGDAYVLAVRVEFVLAGEVASFDAEAFRSSLLRTFRNATGAALTVTSASVLVTASLRFASANHATDAATTINSTPIAIMQSIWFASMNVTIENTPAATMTLVLASAFAATTDQSHSGLPAGGIFGIVFGVFIATVLMGVLALQLRRRRWPGLARVGVDWKTPVIRAVRVRTEPPSSAYEETKQEPLIAEGQPIDRAPINGADEDKAPPEQLMPDGYTGKDGTGAGAMHSEKKTDMDEEDRISNASGASNTGSTHGAPAPAPAHAQAAPAPADTLAAPASGTESRTVNGAAEAHLITSRPPQYPSRAAPTRLPPIEPVAQ